MNKFEQFLIGFGMLSLILLPLAIYSDYKKHIYIEELVYKSYDTQEKIFEMIDANDELFYDLHLQDTYTWYTLEDFFDVYKDYNCLAEEISGIAH